MEENQKYDLLVSKLAEMVVSYIKDKELKDNEKGLIDTKGEGK